ncbi:ClC family H(+)/Cl(-) exchange transporter [Fusibacter ferrireducens]|uniref:ClC family H(+)/Cl(-) exchange transporter n=1 Tax=Fusibacter ferrireducens TaxID=2785058 RepID=A0ABR9ZTZ1_9FIRM|nr:ClC family H(+)/Cl(-) exchange transporter [Fusibacter ferrireducens]MBF4693927.1 ClC family H(+)/Cl(-) exchange transporter [Fusibacter ferrireducens]
MGNNYESITSHNARRIPMVLQSILIGALAGGIVVFYRLILTKAENYAFSMYKYVGEHIKFIPILFVVLILAGFLLSYLTQKNKMIRGSGIPQVKGILIGYFDQNWLSTLLCKFAGGTLAILGGLSLGREGPSIQLGASVAEGIGNKTGKSRMERKILIASGASAGLAAAFNAPLAGVMFALEEIFKYFSPIILLSTMGAAVVADFISKNFFGLEPVFHLEVTGLLGLQEYWLVIVLSIVVGILGAFYNTILIYSQKLYQKVPFLKDNNRIVVPFVCAGLVGLYFPNILGSGHHMFTLLSPDSGIPFLIILLVLKFIFSMISFGSGAPGGIFFPLLVLGATIGAIFAKISILYFGLSPALFDNVIILAMAGFFAAIVRAPITGIVLIMEMTGSLSHMLSLTIVSMGAVIIADQLKSPPIYDALLDNLTAGHKHDAHEEHSKKIVIERVVCHNSIFEDKAVRDVPWPRNCLLVSIKRGEKEFIPNGNTLLKAGDYMFILTDINNEWQNRKSLDKMNS